MYQCMHGYDYVAGMAYPGHFWTPLNSTMKWATDGGIQVTAQQLDPRGADGDEMREKWQI